MRPADREHVVAEHPGRADVSGDGRLARAQQRPDSADVQPRWSTPALTPHGARSEPAASSAPRQRWPDLLEEAKSEPRAWEVYLRAQERRRRLDQEQKGAIWNA